ncbi:Histidinol phosphate phosphatase HisJ family [Modestobacter italicus]|jgi:histidinol-phosphatase (PHP family)|uniref:Histidinol-phosphatase n=1 Tax=Modestobacter italicus (strain DSM 44449 / CECT 9708 / BC 501) TaxID=2732864 RepID=I4EQI9_MODI5|nr:PHP domain-containing protein [Modestobacter marinus]CCH85652.1 Histidinol phosphate phosphatase HisJ family [Modestobacter marinus]
MLPPDNHVHSEFSWDTGPRASLLRACAHAVDIGLPAVAFTEHLDFTVWDAADRATAQGLKDRHPANQLPIDVDLYAETIWEARERYPQLRVWSGVEAGEPHLFGASVAAHLQAAPVDRVLGSLHSLPVDGRLMGVNRLLHAPGIDVVATMRRYLTEMVAMIEHSDVFQVLAHCDFPRRYWPGGRDEYPEAVFEEEYRAVFRALAGSGRALEVNTTSPLWSVELLRWYREEGGDAVSFGSDGHQPHLVGQRFELAVDVVEQAGFRPGRDRFDFWRR